jgi:putative nucleotidyltransferase with HDIG domain
MKDRVEAIKKLREISETTDDYLIKTTALIDFLDTINDPDSTVVDIEEIIKRDASIAAEVLRKANSSIYGLVRKVRTIKQAITIIGINNVEQLFTTQLVHDLVATDSKDEVFEDLWIHSIAVALTAQILSTYSQKKRLWEEYFLAGLLHDLGKFIVRKHLPELDREIFDYIDENPDSRLLIVEKDVMCVSHQEIGAFFARAWNLPPYIVNTIRYHHFFEIAPSNKSIIATVAVADNIVKGMRLGNSRSKYLEPIPRWIWSLLNINQKDFPQLIEKIHSQFKGLMATSSAI